MLGGTLSARGNSLNALRLVLASLVVVSHAWPLGRFGAEPAYGGVTLGGWCVAGFFAISGYLITGSRSQRTFRAFLVSRVARIVPGFWVTLLFSAFVAAPLLSLRYGPWSPVAAWRFIAANWQLRIHEYGVGRTLAGAPNGAVNGSLWTLWFEFRCYLLVGALFLLPVVRRRPALLLAAVFAVCTLDVYFDLLGLAWVGPFATYVPFFFAGALVWALRDRLPTSRSLTAASAGAVLLAGVTGHALLLAPLPLAYGVIHLGYQLPRWARRVGARNDYSYGVYVYAFPVAQMLVAVGVAGAGPWVLALVTLACTMPLAAGSWWLVERRALRAGRRVAERLETRKVPRTGLPGGDRAVRGGEPELATSRA